MEKGPDRLPTDESEEYDEDSADEIIVPIETDEQEFADLVAKKLLIKGEDGLLIDPLRDQSYLNYSKSGKLAADKEAPLI